jgi:hypothetical protein
MIQDVINAILKESLRICIMESLEDRLGLLPMKKYQLSLEKNLWQYDSVRN